MIAETVLERQDLMEQKNTIVKCTANPSCLFNHNGICDNYVITIGADGSCQEYIETEVVESLIQDPVKIGLALKELSKQMDVQRVQRAKCNFLEKTFDVEYEELFNAANNMLKPAGVELKQENQMCWYCDHGKHGKCKFPVKPMRNPNGECCRFASTGGNR